MSIEEVRAKYVDLLRSASKCLIQIGFSRRGNVFFIEGVGCRGIIGFQKSMSSKKSCIKFTINIGVVYSAALHHSERSLESATIEDAHLRCRVGSITKNGEDFWWFITTSTNDNSLSLEISDILTSKIVPFVKKYMQRDQFLALLESGRSPGLTAVQRSRVIRSIKGNGSI